MRRRALALPAIASLVFALSCDEKLLSGPDTFSANVQIVATRDTIVIGDSSIVTARTTDAQGRVVQGLTYTWTSADTNIISLRPANTTNPDAVAGRTRTLIAKRAGLSNLTMALADSRFVNTGDTRTETSVVGGVRILTTRDTTLTSINDTAVAIAAGLVRVGATMVTRSSLGVKWTQKGNRTFIVGTGDTIRFVARTNGVDTLIATHDFCLAGQKCADTVFARVAQTLTLGLSTRNFLAWSFSDSVGPTVVLADRRGFGQIGTSVRFVPRTTQDSNLVRVIGPFGSSNPVSGTMAAPKLLTAGNGTARVLVQGIAADGQTVVATDSVSVTIRQVARRVAAEPQRASVTFIDSIPVRGVARDARGAVIADATVDLTSVGITLNGIWAGPTASTAIQGTLIPTLTGIALPTMHPSAPQVAVALDPALVTLPLVDSIKAGIAQAAISVQLVDSTGQPGQNRWVRFTASNGPSPDSVISAADGFVTVVWNLSTLAGPYTLTGVRGTPGAMLTTADSAGRIVIRRTVEIIADDPATTLTSAAMSATNIAQGATATLTITARDRFNNIVKNVLPTVFTVAVSAGGGSVGPLTCNLGICTATYTAPAATINPTVTVQIAGVNVLNSPISLTVP